ncbi:MAG TPA: chemotaxis protein CheB [Bacteroidales bacterium]|nr:chemotaxis protein CheB [Bacteroidales bacterium]
MNKEIKTLSEISHSVDSIPVQNTEPDQEIFRVVGVGASAGGFEALEQLFRNMPEKCGLAFVVIQHLSPTHKGMLGELLQRVTRLKVYTVTDRMKVKPDAIYVIPSNRSMTITNGEFHIFKPIEKQGLRLPIDLFFRSLAEDRKENSIGIILSGMGSDGSLGLKAIKEKAGLVLVQDPASAKFDSMPRSSIEAVMVDIIAPADELAARLITLTTQSDTIGARDEDDKDTSALEKVITLLRNQTGNDFSQYKKSTMYRRIERRMGIHQLNKIASYVLYLQQNPAELDILFKELLIGVTSFFRNAPVWEELKENILPSLFAKMPQKYLMRAWVPGCSTGEEAYSLAIVFREALEKANLNKNISLQIFATDLDNNAIERARRGVFTANICADVSPERLKRFFTKTGELYRINGGIREMVVFAPQNIIRDPSFTKLDFLSCRNLLIYLDSDLQKKLLAMFHYSLVPGGILLLGSAETHGSQGNLFTAVNSKLRIYERSSDPVIEGQAYMPGSSEHNKPDTGKTLQAFPPDNLQTLTDQLLLHQYTPASVLVNHTGDILYITGNTVKYLSASAGKANMNIFAMAKEGLRTLLPKAFQHAMQDYEKIVLESVRIKNNSKTQLTNVSIQQLESPPGLKNKFLVVFTDVPEENHLLKAAIGKSGFKNKLETEFKFEIRRLKDELESTREEMQTSQEELKSTNEELQSTNEELQSANEELTTSKEEMQSMNEELQTINVELQSKVDDSVRIGNDMNNLLESIEIATLFLDNELNIRQFTTPATRIFKMKQSDIGRLFTDQVTDLAYPEMYNDVSEVLRTHRFIEKPVPTLDGRVFNVRIMPYRTFENKIDGLVITFINVTESKKLEHDLKDSRMMFQSFIEELPAGFISLSADGTITSFNREAERLTGYDCDLVTGGNFLNLFLSESLHEIESGMKQLASGAINRLENHIKGINGNEIVIEWFAPKTVKGEGTFFGLMKNF